MLTVHTLTHPGSVREINEDSVLWDADLALMAIADGMGGHNAGEVASRIAIDAVRSFFRKSVTDDGFTWPFGFNTSASFDANRLVTAMKIANRRVFREAEERTEYLGMGTTVVTATVTGRRLAFSSVGDSRLYSFDGSELRQLTRDDSWIVMLTQESGLDPAAFANHPMRHVLTNVIGARPEVDIVAHELDLAEGQTLMFSTDGLHGPVLAEAIRTILQSEKQLDRAAEALVDAALKLGGSDNITVLLARYTEQ